jgi:CRP/FNR family cyclic AMP-dependent transcriptional regulator
VRAVLYFLGCLSDLDIKWLVSSGRALSFDEGETLVVAGTPLTDVFFLMEGDLSVRVGISGDQEVNRMKYGEFFGEISFLDSRPPSATIVAVTPVRVLAIDRDDIEGKLDRDAEFGARFFRGIGVLLANRIRGLIQHVDESKELDLYADEVAGELDPDLLDTINLAGRRFDLMLDLFRDSLSRG